MSCSRCYLLQVSGREVFEFRPELVDDDDEEADDTKYATVDDDDDFTPMVTHRGSLYV